MPAATVIPDRDARVRLVRAARDGDGRPVVNGIERVEVDPRDDGRRVRLRVFFVHPLPGEDGGIPGAIPLRPADLRIEGGTRIQSVAILDVTATGRVLAVTVEPRGDFSTYSLIVDAPRARMDPPLARIDVSFRADCPSDFDCAPTTEPAPSAAIAPAPRIDYLAKDFASFRRLMLDRLAALVPDWTERNPADAGVALVELLAYVGDYLSYRQDAIATEAYLGTARRRVSVRRHAQLVDYPMHDGCNARGWLQIAVTAEVRVPPGTACWTSVPGRPLVVDNPAERDRALAFGAQVFETMTEAALRPERNRLEFHDWGTPQDSLPIGTTGVTLRDPGRALRLLPGDVILLEQVLGPATGKAVDADPALRHLVRLTSVTELEDAVGGTDGGPLPVLDVRWRSEEALPFSLPVGLASGQPVATASANFVAVDHGSTVAVTERLPPVPEPVLARAPLTYSTPFDAGAPTAAAALGQDPRQARPSSLILTDDANERWTPRPSLVDSGPHDRHVVVEVESDGVARLRFGDGQFGARPDAGTRFTAGYRVGNGSLGNVGADAIRHLLLPDGLPADAEVLAVRNPLAAQGGVDQEGIDEVRLAAPADLRRWQRRAVTADDYVRFVTELDDVQGATAVTRWTGRTRTIFVTVDRVGGAEVDAAFTREVLDGLEPLRLAGHDVVVDAPRLVPLEISLRLRVRPEAFRSDVRRVLEAEFSGRVLPDGRRGFFHPDNLTFGQPVFLSRLVAVAQGVEGVVDVVVTTFQRQGVADPRGLDTGLLAFGRQEIPLLDNDPNFADRGVLRIELEGGR